MSVGFNIFFAYLPCNVVKVNFFFLSSYRRSEGRCIIDFGGVPGGRSSSRFIVREWFSGDHCLRGDCPEIGKKNRPKFTKILASLSADWILDQLFYFRPKFPNPLFSIVIFGEWLKFRPTVYIDQLFLFWLKKSSLLSTSIRHSWAVLCEDLSVKWAPV